MTIWLACHEACADKCPCPTCGRSLPPIGHDLPPYVKYQPCCLEAHDDPTVNSRHVWGWDPTYPQVREI